MKEIRNDVMVVKELNIETVRAAIRSLGKATKAELAAQTGISVVSCNKILNDLCAAGEVLATDEMKVPEVHGRAARVYQYNAVYQLVGCVYFATDHEKIIQCSVVADLTGKVLEQKREEIHSIDDACILEAVRQLAAQHSKLRVCAVGLPASVHRGVIKLSSFSELNGMPLQQHLQHELPDIKILVENDTNAIAYGFYRTACGSRDTTIGLIFSPDGVCTSDADNRIWHNRTDATINDLSLGAGFVSCGRILRGFSGFAGEIWSLPALREQTPGMTPVNPMVITDIVLSIIAILNPEIIALTGGYITEKRIEEVREQCSKRIHPQDMPKLLYRSDTHMDYIQGLVHIALEQLSCDVQIIRKEI